MSRQERRNFPWLTHFYVVMIHEVGRVFASIATYDFNQHVLSAGQSLPASACQLALYIMQQMQTSLKSGILRNSIGKFAQPPASYAFFRSSIEGIPRTPRNQCTSNSQATSQRSNIPAKSQRSDAPTKSQRSIDPRSNTRFTQRTNIPTIKSEETGWIVKK